MPPKLKMKSKKGGKKKGTKKKKKGEKKEKAEVPPPPLHHLTELYNQLRGKLYDLESTQGKARERRLEGWYVSREMLSLQHDNDVYHQHLKDKMDDTRSLIEDITIQLERERSEVDKVIKERMGEINRRIGEYKGRILRAEQELNELRIKLMEFDSLIKKFAGLLARLKELQEMIPGAEVDSNVKTRHLKNQYLMERAKLHNHLENELYNLITTCRSHLIPILSNHMNSMELENRCNRWDLMRLDIANAKFSRQKELLLEKRNRLITERPYLSIQWAFNKLAQCEAKRKEEAHRARRNKMKGHGPPAECELSIAFKQYLSKRLVEERGRQKEEVKRKRTKEEQTKFEEEMEKAKKLAAAEEEEEEEDGFDESMEYYEDEQGNIVIAPLSRMKEHMDLMEDEEYWGEEEEEREEEKEEEDGGVSDDGPHSQDDSEDDDTEDDDGDHDQDSSSEDSSEDDDKEHEDDYEDDLKTHSAKSEKSGKKKGKGKGRK